MASLRAPYSAALSGPGDRPRSRYARNRNFMICLLFGSPGTANALPQRPGRNRSIHEDEPRPRSVTAARARSHPRTALRLFRYGRLAIGYADERTRLARRPVPGAPGAVARARLPDARLAA